MDQTARWCIILLETMRKQQYSKQIRFATANRLHRKHSKVIVYKQTLQTKVWELISAYVQEKLFLKLNKKFSQSINVLNLPFKVKI